VQFIVLALWPVEQGRKTEILNPHFYVWKQLDAGEVRGGERPSSKSSISDKRKLIWQQRQKFSRASYFS
jgi:hypothetical protein